LKFRKTGEEFVRTIIAVIGGFLGIAVLIRLTDMLFARMTPGWESEGPSAVLLRCKFRNGFRLHDCGRIPMRADCWGNRRRATLWLILLGEALGVVVQAMLWGSVPH